MAAFEELGVMPALIEAMEDMGWQLPRDVQAESVPLILGGGDVMIAAETGAGKTGAFAIPIIQLIYENLTGVAKVSNVDPPKVGGKMSSLVWTNGSLKVEWDVRDRVPILAISSDGLVCQARHERDWGGGRANAGFAKGKWFYEAIVTDEGLGRVGWATGDSNLMIGTDDKSWGYGGTAKRSWNNKFEDYGEQYGKGDAIGAYLDLDNGSMAFSKNGKWFGQAFPLPQQLRGKPLYPALSLKNAEMSFNFGADPNLPFKFPPTNGYRPCATAKEGEAVEKPQPKESPEQQQQKQQQSSEKGGGGGGGGGGGRGPMAVIIEPTQELAKQVANQVELFVKFLPDPAVRYVLVTGAVEHGNMARALAGGAHIVIGTLGTMKSLIKSGKLNLSNCYHLVVDEADSMLDQGNKGDLMEIYDTLPHKGEKAMQVILCSATLHSPEIASFAEAVTHHATWVDLKGKDHVPELVDHAFLRVDPEKDGSWRKSKDSALLHDNVHGHEINGNNPDSLSYGAKLLKPQILLEIINAFKMEQCLIFCRTRLDCENIEHFLNTKGGGQKFRHDVDGKGKENPYSCAVLHGGKSKEREQNLDYFRQGLVRFLICTDVAARGIDIKELPYVINITLPEPSEQYIHRIGRVGRAGFPGLAISLVSSVKEKVWWHECNRPDRGLGCRNTKLVGQGGCCKWYDEQGLKKEIEERLSKGRPEPLAIPWLDRTNLVKGREHFTNLARAPYLASSKESQEAVASQAHIETLKPAVRQLAELEIQAQYNYIALTYTTPTFGNPSSDPKRAKK